MLGVQQVEQPLPRQLLGLHAGGLVRLVDPVGGNPCLRDAVHLHGADLDLEGGAEGTEDTEGALCAVCASHAEGASHTEGASRVPKVP